MTEERRVSIGKVGVWRELRLERCVSSANNNLQLVEGPQV